MSLASNDQPPAPPRPPDVLLPDAILALTADANIGGTEAILAGRPGSWEAERVRQVLQSTVGGNDEYLWSHRTEPITITINVASILDYGPAQQQYETAEADIERQRETLGLRIVTGTPDDRTGRSALPSSPSPQRGRRLPTNLLVNLAKRTVSDRY
jgi:hypothetical protein